MKNVLAILTVCLLSGCLYVPEAALIRLIFVVGGLLVACVALGILASFFPASSNSKDAPESKYDYDIGQY